MVGTAAIIMVMTAFNGLENLVSSLYASFDPAVKVEPAKGKTFRLDQKMVSRIRQLESVESVGYSLEEIALVRYGDQQTVATVKGVSPEIITMSGIDTLMCEGELVMEGAGNQFAVMGYGISYHLSFFANGIHSSPMSVFVPRPGSINSLDPGKSFYKQDITPVGVFCIGPDFDNKYVLVPYKFMENLLKKDDVASSLEIQIVEGEDPFDVKDEVATLLGDKFVVKTREEQNELIFKTNQMEKWIVFMILSFILFIATFNTISNITMLIIDKQDDIWILKSMGANTSMIRRIFMSEGMLINMLGGIAGMLIGLILCLLQIHVGLLPMEGAVVEYYPMKLELMDFVLAGLIVLITGFISSWYPVQILTRKRAVTG